MALRSLAERAQRTRSAALTLAVRDVDLRHEMPVLVDVFNRGFNVELPAARFEWLYQQNPDGPSTCWFVIDERSGEIAGCTAVFPRRIQVRGQSRPVVAWNCGDFCILPRYRVGGAALALRRAARNAVDAGESPFLYAHPNDRMLQIHLRVGHQPLGTMIRLARPVRVAAGGGIAARVGTLALRLARPERVLAWGDTITVAGGPLPADVDGLFERVRGDIGTALVRDARYLTWRFLDCPLHEYRFALARRGGELAGYLAFCLSGGQLLVKDWLGVDARAVRALFGAAIDEAIAADAASASVTLLDTHRDIGVLRSMGFAQRAETSTSITYVPDHVPWRADVANGAAWYMTVGDRDV